MSDVVQWLINHKTEISMFMTLIVLVCNFLEEFKKLWAKAKHEARNNYWCTENGRLAICWQWAVGLGNTKRDCANCTHNHNHRDGVRGMCGVKYADKPEKRKGKRREE